MSPPHQHRTGAAVEEHAQMGQKLPVRLLVARPSHEIQRDDRNATPMIPGKRTSAAAALPESCSGSSRDRTVAVLRTATATPPVL